MSIVLNRIGKRILAAFLKVVPFVIFLIKIPYWGIIKIIINYWGKRGIHSVTVGQFSGGTTKTRSLYREEMLLKTMLLFINVREKSCLDLACNDGFWSFQLTCFGLRIVTGIDSSRESIIRANFLKHVYDFPDFDFKRQDILDFLYHHKEKSFDIILLLSIIYHLPEKTDWNSFFRSLSRINNECLIIDSRWFEDNTYWYDKTSEQSVIQSEEGLIEKWRPTRKEVIDYLYKSGYEQVVEINPSAFLQNPKEAYGNGDPYTLENVSDYITGHRTLVIAYKEKTAMPNTLDRLTVEYVQQEN